MSLTLVLMLAGQFPAQTSVERAAVLPASASIHRPLREELLEQRVAQASDAPTLPPVPGSTDGLDAVPPPPPPEEESYDEASPPLALQPLALQPVAPGCCFTAMGNHGYGQVAGGLTPGCPGCPVCLEEDDTKVCKLHTTGDMYPHFAYYPTFHGYYYFRPYSYTAVAEHQRFATCIGLDPRMPYTLSGFDRIYSSFPIQFTPTQAPTGTALPLGSGLPELENLLALP